MRDDWYCQFSLNYFKMHLKGQENVLFELGSERVNTMQIDLFACGLKHKIINLFHGQIWSGHLGDRKQIPRAPERIAPPCLFLPDSNEIIFKQQLPGVSTWASREAGNRSFCLMPVRPNSKSIRPKGKSIRTTGPPAWLQQPCRMQYKRQTYYFLLSLQADCEAIVFVRCFILIHR